jgi:hypothetical protein
VRALEVRLVVEQQVVHLPELALPACNLGRQRGLQRMSMDLLERKVPPDEPHAAREALQQQLQRRRCLLAVRALEVPVLDERDRRVTSA